jgi:hypothetical protein
MTRRQVLAAPAVLAAGRKPRVAVVMNVYFPNSHADVFVGRLLDGFRLDRAFHAPRLETVSFYVDQFPVNDMAREQADEHGIRIFKTPAEALRLGGKKIAVDAVAVIGEHGEYPRTPRGNIMYPRARYFDEIVRVMQEDGRVVPVYQDKYFAYEWADAKRMYDTARRMKIPLLCGSTVPLAWRRPPIEVAKGTRFTEVLTTSFSDIEEHGYHAIELLQAMAERRQGGETGVARVRHVAGEAVWKLAESGEWRKALLDAALARRVNPVPAGGQPAPEAILIRYRDGLKGAVLHDNARVRDYIFAGTVADRAEPLASCFYIQLYLHNHWSFMVRNFEDLVLTRREPNPVERTLYANGILLAGLESRRQGGIWIDTPELSLSY